jgi:hypothetical protein
MPSRTICINRAPVLTLWAVVLAERLGFDQEEPLTLGKALAGLNAQSKGRSLGIFKPHEENPSRHGERSGTKHSGSSFAVGLRLPRTPKAASGL